MESWQYKGMRQRTFLFAGMLLAAGLLSPPAFAQGSGPGALFNPDVPNFQRSQFSTTSNSFDLARNRFQDHRTTFQPTALQLNGRRTRAADTQLSVQSDMNVQLAAGADQADFTNEAERNSLREDRQSRFSNMRLQFEDPALQFLNFNP